MKALVTGLEPFGGEPVNPALEALRLLPARLEAPALEITTRVMPAVFGRSLDALDDALGAIIPDIVLFVNGIPFAVIECKRPDIKGPLEQAISQNIRNQRDVGGGALYDVGGYAILTARLAFGAEPTRVAAVCDRDPETGCDRLTSAIVDFGVGQATFVVGTQHVAYQRVHVFGTRGHIEVEIPFNAPNNRPCRVLVDDGAQGAPDFTIQETSDDRAEALTLPVANHYTLQGQSFSEAIRGGKAPHLSEYSLHQRSGV
jgi:hypothetical protein